MTAFPDATNWIGGQEVPAQSGDWFDKLNPATGQPLCRVARSTTADVNAAVEAAKSAYPAWAAMPAVQRGMLLHEIVKLMQARADEFAGIVAAETGKTRAEGAGETGGAAQLGLFYASEGQRLYGRTTTSGIPHRQSSTIRVPLGVAGLIIAANTPIANVAWKVFPALVCGNSVVLKAAEDTPLTAWIFAKAAKDAGLPDGVLNVIQGYGAEAGQPLVEHPDVPVISFTGSSKVGTLIYETVAKRMGKVSLELGGKNALVVCEDADLDNAVDWIAKSAFSNAGQRCAAASRIIVFDSVYDELKKRLLTRTQALRVGTEDGVDLGPVINQRQLDNMLTQVNQAVAEGATVAIGGKRMTGSGYDGGFFMAPTIVENVNPSAEISKTELFGPITILYRATDYAEALALANDSPYGLTASIHTRDLHKALDFTRKVNTGVVSVNGGTHGSEPHMPFGGLGLSGNGTREPGTEALDIYTELRDVYIHVNPDLC